MTTTMICHNLDKDYVLLWRIVYNASIQSPKWKLHFTGYTQSVRCATNADCRLADWQVNEVNIVLNVLNTFSIPKL